MLLSWTGNEYCWREEARCGDAGCSELYIVHLLDTFAIIALQHNSGTTLAVPRVSALHYPSCPLTKTLTAEHTQMERDGEGAKRLSHTCTGRRTRPGYQCSLRSFGFATCPGGAYSSAQLSS